MNVLAVKKPVKKKPASKRRSRRTQRQVFVDQLTALSNKGEKMVGNKALIDSLGWERNKYERVKEQLCNENQIIKGRGHGGSVGLAKVPGTRALRLFLSYSHADEKFANRLLQHLKPLQHMELIDEWHDRKIKPGDEWAGQISKHLKNADIIVLLVSIDFINSKYCYEIEMEEALSRHEDGGARVVPVIARNCLWHSSPFAKLQALPRDARAIASWPDQDEAFVDIAEGLKRIATELSPE